MNAKRPYHVGVQLQAMRAIERGEIIYVPAERFWYNARLWFMGAWYLLSEAIGVRHA